jgi:MFS family permease
LIFATGLASAYSLVWAGVALAVLAIATVTYLPAASAFVVDLAPESLRGVYLSVNSQCWAIGYFVGPPLGGWALDQSEAIAYGFWIALALSTGLAIAILRGLHRLQAASSSHE